MELEGKIWKSNKHWLVEVPTLDVMTQGRSRKEALEMIRDAVYELICSYFTSEVAKDFEVVVHDYKAKVIGISATDTRLLLAFSLRRERERSGLTVREAAERLGAKTHNTYAQYERGRIRISVDQYEKLLCAANPQRQSILIRAI